MGTTAPELYRSEENQGRFQQLKSKAQLTRYGGDAYFFCMMAAGHMDIAMDCGLQPYDITPLLPIVTGAGGFAAEWTGGDIMKGGKRDHRRLPRTPGRGARHHVRLIAERRTSPIVRPPNGVADDRTEELG